MIEWCRQIVPFVEYFGGTVYDIRIHCTDGDYYVLKKLYLAIFSWHFDFQ